MAKRFLKYETTDPKLMVSKDGLLTSAGIRDIGTVTTIKENEFATGIYLFSDNMVSDGWYTYEADKYGGKSVTFVYVDNVTKKIYAKSAGCRPTFIYVRNIDATIHINVFCLMGSINKLVFDKETFSWDIYIVDNNVKWHINDSESELGYYLYVKELNEYGYTTTIGCTKDLVIQSSTEGSTKKFKITVDDDGVLSATEV